MTPFSASGRFVRSRFPVFPCVPRHDVAVRVYFCLTAPMTFYKKGEWRNNGRGGGAELFTRISLLLSSVFTTSLMAFQVSILMSGSRVFGPVANNPHKSAPLFNCSHHRTLADRVH